MVTAALGAAGFGALAAVLLRRLWRVQVATARHRKRRRGQRAWVELSATWHTPLLLLGLAIAVVRVAFFTEIHVARGHRPHSDGDATSMLWQRWLLLEFPSALAAISSAYLVFFHAHVALYCVWPIRFGSTSPSFRSLLVAFTTLLLLVVWLLASARVEDGSVFTSSEWTQLSLKYFGAVWIVLGAVLLKIQAQSGDVMWAERGVGRLLVISPRGLHLLVATEALFALTMVARGTMCAMLTIEPEDLLPADPAKVDMTTFLAVYGIWEVVTIGVIYCLCGCVPVYSRARRLVGYADETRGGTPVVASQPTLHFAMPSPKQAVTDYFHAATAAFQNPRRHTCRSFERSSVYDVPAELDDVDDDDRLLEGDTFHEPLLTSHMDVIDADEAQLSCDRRRPNQQ